MNSFLREVRNTTVAAQQKLAEAEKAMAAAQAREQAELDQAIKLKAEAIYKDEAIPKIKKAAENASWYTSLNVPDYKTACTLIKILEKEGFAAKQIKCSRIAESMRTSENKLFPGFVCSNIKSEPNEYTITISWT